MIVDAHCHLVSIDEPEHSAISFATYLDRARAAGIDRSVVFSGFAQEYRAQNRRVAALAARHPDRLLGYACLHARNEAGRVDSLVEDAVRSGLRGLKVHRRDAEITDEVCVAARRHGLPVLYDPHDDVDVIADFGKRHPEVDFVVPHLGSFSDNFRAQLRCIDHVARLPNLLADTSAIKVFDLLVELVMRVGARKVIFGSDGPWLHPGLELAKVRALGLPPGQEQLVLGGNLLRILRPRRRSPDRFASRVPSAVPDR